MSRWTGAAEENNAENLRVIQAAEMAARYAQNSEIHRRHSEAYTGLPGHDESQPGERKLQWEGLTAGQMRRSGRIPGRGRGKKTIAFQR